jgi:hypothetical protein
MLDLTLLLPLVVLWLSLRMTMMLMLLPPPNALVPVQCRYSNNGFVVVAVVGMVTAVASRRRRDGPSSFVRRAEGAILWE